MDLEVARLGGFASVEVDPHGAVTDLIGPTGRRFYFCDAHPQTAVVTLASSAERALLEYSRPTRLLERSEWWKAITTSE